jgi:Transcriptional regulatory protein, C terminal
MWNNYLSEFNHWRSVKRPSARYVCSPLEGKAPNPGRNLQNGLTGFGQIVIPPFQVCAILLEHSGELVTRDELRKKVWPEDTFVDFDHALNTAITKIRAEQDEKRS